ncbi:MAG: hypothetical protein AB7G13_03890 [Lautropia sp.]
MILDQPPLVKAGGHRRDVADRHVDITAFQRSARIVLGDSMDTQTLCATPPNPP